MNCSCTIFRSVEDESQKIRSELVVLNELINAENESRKIEIESLDQFVTSKYPEKVISIIDCSC